MTTPIRAADIDFRSAVSAAERLTRIAEGHYLFSAGEHGTDIEVSHVRVERGELRGRVKVFCSLAGVHTVNGVLFTSEITFSRFSGRKDLAQALQRRTRAKGVNWEDIVDEFVIRVEMAEETRVQVTDLSSVHVPAPGSTPVLVGGFWPLYLFDPNTIYGKGGDGKSLLATYAAGWLHQNGVPTLIIDYEMTEDPQAERLAALFGSERPHVLHYRATRPLVYELDQLERLLHDHRIRFVIVDSAVPASHGNVNDADTAAAYYATLRRLGVGSLSVAHVTKQSTTVEARPEEATPFGSAFWSNLSRSAWHLRRADDRDDPSRITCGLFHAKHNYGAKFRPIGVELRFQDGRTTISRVDAAEVPEFAGSISVNQRIRHLLKQGALSPEAIEGKLDDVDPATIKRTIRRYSSGKVMHFHRLADGRIGLAETRRTA